jgi:hypothetical protein
MTTQESLHLQKYRDVIGDILNNRSTSQMLRKNFLIDGQMCKVDEDTVYDLRQLVAKRKLELKRQGLSGIDAQHITAPDGEPTNNTQPGRPYAAAVPSASSYEHERPQPGYMQAPLTDMQAHVQNAELRSEIRFLKMQLSSTEKELQKLQQQGLGNTELSTEHIFLKRDYAELQKKHDDAERRLKEIEPDYEELKEDSRTWARLEKAATMLASQPEMFISILSAINPVAGRNAASALSGMSGGEARQLSSLQATQIAAAMDEAFQQEEQRMIATMINHFSQRKELIAEMHYLLQRRLEELSARAQQLGDEASGDAETI